MIASGAGNTRFRIVLATGLLGCFVGPLASAADDFPPPGWAKLADAMAQRLECLKIAGKSEPDGMKCLLAQANKLPQIDHKHREWFGESYDPSGYRECLRKVGRPIGTAGCEPYRLMRQIEPEHWPYPDARWPKWPEAPLQPIYRDGMTSEAYFDALCNREAGEFVYRVVEDVDGIYQVRPRKRAWDYALQDRFVMEDPYGYTEWEARSPETVFVRGEFAAYRFLESAPRNRPLPEYRQNRYDDSLFSAPPVGAVVERYFGYDGRSPETLRKEYDTKARSRYGFTWRGIRRPHDRELAIAGGELMVFDLQTGEVLGVRRGFARSGFVRNSRSGVQWETAAVCPKLRRQPDGWDKSGDFSYWFVSKVAQPRK